jgi:hypothetical protein
VLVCSCVEKKEMKKIRQAVLTPPARIRKVLVWVLYVLALVCVCVCVLYVLVLVCVLYALVLVI